MRNTLTLSFALALITFALGYVVSDLVHKYTADASTGWGEEYNAQVLTSSNASGTASTFLKSGYGSLGSIIIASTSAATVYPQIIVYDATSTEATSTGRVIARFATNNTTPGTYTFDAVFTDGLKVEVAPGFTGAWTVTWR